MNARTFFLLALCGAIGAACNARETSTVRLDLAALRAHAALTTSSIDRVELRVFATDMQQTLLFVLDTMETGFDVEIPAGGARHFDLEATGPGAGGVAVPMYWGEAVADLPADTVVDLVLPVYPSGRVEGLLTVPYGAELPAEQLVLFVPDVPVEDVTEPLAALAVDGVFVRTLPVGAYAVAGRFDVGDIPFEVRDPVRFEISHGVVTPGVEAALVPPPGCRPELDLIPDKDNDGAPCHLDCDDEDPLKNLLDEDGDGATTCDNDCDDDPDACGANCVPSSDVPDICDGMDNDCDGAVDEDPDRLWYADTDSDGFGAAAVSIAACTAPASAYVSDSSDCDDGRDSAYPGAPEVPADGIDQDCDGRDTCYVDADGDGYGNPLAVTADPSDADCGNNGAGGPVANASDCDDTSATIHPAAVETPVDGVDQNCDGVDACYADVDGDGYGALLNVLNDPSDTDCGNNGAGEPVANASDCDDAHPSVYPGASEVPTDGVDQDCDGVDVCYADADADAYGDAGVEVDDPSDLDCGNNTLGEPVANATDCDDGDGDERPGQTWYADCDNDGHFDPTHAIAVCSREQATATDPCGDAAPPDGGYQAATSGDDCNDLDVSIYPGAPEITADGTDQDCDNLDACYADADSDTFGDAATVVDDPDDTDCTNNALGQPVADNTDCDDTDTDEHPGQSWYPDCDGDGHHRDATAVAACSREDATSFDPCGDSLVPDGGYRPATPGDDCDDTAPTVYTGAAETPADGIDQDCDNVDSCYADADSDTFGDAAAVVDDPGDTDCTNNALGQPVADNTDCDDTDSDEHPGQSWYPDCDGDGHHRDTTALAACSREDATTADPCGDSLAPDGGYGPATPGDDCDDTAPTVYTGAAETPADGIDQDCDNVDSCYADADSDTYGDAAATADDPGDTDCTNNTLGEPVADNTDCDDTDPTVSPVGTDLPADGVDQDCNGRDACYADTDGDGYGDSGSITDDPSDLDCTNNAPFEPVGDATDCNDSDGDEFPGQVWYPDCDNDGFFTDNVVPTAVVACTRTQADATGSPCGGQNPPMGGFQPGVAGADCDDEDPAFHPNAADTVSGGIDYNCDGIPGTDADGDGFASMVGDPDGTDCDDTRADVNPDGTEVPGDAADEDCDGRAADVNADGNDVVPYGTDCDDDGDGARSFACGGTDIDDSDASASVVPVGSFSENTPLHAAPPVRALFIADMNRDAHPDIVAAGGSNIDPFVSIFDAGVGTAQPSDGGSTGDTNTAAAIGDFDGNAYLDIAVAGTTVVPSPSQHVRICANPGTGSLNLSCGASYGLTLVPAAMAVIDYDRDGHQDLAVAGSDGAGSDTIEVLRNDGDGTFDTTTFRLTAAPNAVDIVAVDLDNDGWQDLATVHTGSDQIRVRLSDGAGGFASEVTSVYDPTTTATPLALAAGLLDADAYLDLAVSATVVDVEEMFVMLGVGNGTFVAPGEPPPPTYTLSSPAADIVVGDTDGDSNADLIFLNSIGYTDAGYDLYPGDGAGGFSASGVQEAWGAAGPGSTVTAGDVVGDGKVEILVGTDAGEVICFQGFVAES